MFEPKIDTLPRRFASGRFLARSPRAFAASAAAITLSVLNVFSLTDLQKPANPSPKVPNFSPKSPISLAPDSQPQKLSDAVVPDKDSLRTARASAAPAADLTFSVSKSSPLTLDEKEARPSPREFLIFLQNHRYR